MTEENKSVEEKENSQGSDPNKKSENHGEASDKNVDSKKLEKLEEINANLDRALELERAKLEKEQALRELREQKRSLKSQEQDSKSDESNTEEKKFDKDSLVKEVRQSLLKETRENSMKLAKAEFYKTDLGKRYDPINDSDGKNFEALQDLLILKDTDISKEDIFRRYRAAAIAHQQELVDVVSKQEQKNQEAANQALNDLGSGGFSNSNNRNVSNSDKIVLTAEQKKHCAERGISEERYIEALKKVKETSGTYKQIKLA